MPDTRKFPYPAPASCRTSPTTGHETRERFPAWWLVGQGITVGTPVGVLYQGDNKLYWTWDHPAPFFTLTGARAGEPTATVQLLMGGPTTGGPSTVRFSASGCWRIHAVGDAQVLDATVYVYPWACEPEGMRGAPPPSPEPCIPPSA